MQQASAAMEEEHAKLVAQQALSQSLDEHIAVLKGEAVERIWSRATPPQRPRTSCARASRGGASWGAPA